MKKILITGAKGRIGRILSKELADYYKLTLIDLPENDVRDYNSLLRIFPKHNVVIHLAWNSKKENFQSKEIDLDNVLMFSNIYRASLETRVPRVIMASSIHADDFRSVLGKKSKKLLNPSKIPFPLNPYGANKIFMESLGRYYAEKGLGVVCVRFGASGYEKPTPKEKEGMAVWLSDYDCAELIKKIIEAKKVPNNFSIVYGISNNKKRVHDFSNPFGWKPKDDSYRN